MTIKSYIQFAYDIPNWDWIIGPAWLNNDSPAYTITAKASSAVPERTIRIMLRHLLAERFELKTHTEFRDQAVYALVVGKGRSKLQPVQYEEADADRCVRPLTTGLEAHHCSMEAFASVLSGQFGLGRPVVDQTGLTGRYDFAMRYATLRGFLPLREATEDLPGPTIFDAIQDLGLKLEPRKAPVEVLVVDHVNKTPTEN